MADDTVASRGTGMGGHMASAAVKAKELMAARPRMKNGCLYQPRLSGQAHEVQVPGGDLSLPSAHQEIRSLRFSWDRPSRMWF